MKLTFKIELSDERLRRIRAGMKRGGKATRMETRIWLARVVDAAAEELPDVVTRGAAPSQIEVEAVAAYPSKLEAAMSAAPDALCVHCGEPKSHLHGLMGFSCMKAPGKMFRAAEGGAQ